MADKSAVRRAPPQGSRYTLCSFVNLAILIDPASTVTPHGIPSSRFEVAYPPVFFVSAIQKPVFADA